MTLPIFYSFRRCPYAIRARLALKHSGAHYIHREIELKDKPAHMLEVSSKGTVPVLAIPMDSNRKRGLVTNNVNTTASYRVIDESIDIMHWAINGNHSGQKHNANEWLVAEAMSIDEINALIQQNDDEFKNHLDKYKYSDRHPEHTQTYYFEQAIPFLEKLESVLAHSPYLGGTQFRLTDAAILPFIRQFSMVRPKQFETLALPNLQQWLANGLESELFVSVMGKTPRWTGDEDEDLVMGGIAE